MADAPVPSLARARELKISELSTFFANDDLSLEDLEQRIERVYKASSVSELDAITADLQKSPAVPDEYARALAARATPSTAVTYTVASTRLMSLMSSTRRVGRWVVPEHLDVVAVMSDTVIDMTQASLAPGLTEVELRCVLAAFKMIVPPNVRVVNDLHAVMSSIENRADEILDDKELATAGSIIRLSGYALMSAVMIVVRRSEDIVE
jgi:hypothetical protein